MKVVSAHSQADTLLFAVEQVFDLFTAHLARGQMKQEGLDRLV